MFKTPTIFVAASISGNAPRHQKLFGLSPYSIAIRRGWAAAPKYG
jgi:hypothetical protein